MTTGRASQVPLASVVLVAATALLANFARMQQLGLYEDDYWSIAPHLGEPVSHLLGTLVSNFTTWPTGRPLNHFLPVFLSRMGSRLGGLEGAYGLAAAWLALNGGLVYAIVRRLTSEQAGVVSAMAYLLFPADSTKTLLVHAAHVQGAMTFLLLGVWLWLRGGRCRAASYPVAALSLLSYETAFLPFLGVPLLRAPDRRTLLRTLGIHLAACAGIVAAIAAIRFATGDVRAIDAAGNPARTLYRMTTSLFLGPLTSGWSLLASALAGWRQVDALAALDAAFLVLGFGAVLQAIRWRDSMGQGAPERASPALERVAADQPSWSWLVAGAVLVWAGSYALVLTNYNYPPTQTVGRLTSTHVAAGWPVSLLLGALFEGARRRSRRWSWAAAVLFAAWLASMVTYHHHLQREYVSAWRQQQRFWKDVMALAPDAGPGWAVIAEGIPAPSTPVIYANSWADYCTYALIFPERLDERRPAFGHLGYLGQLIQFRRDGERVTWRPRWWDGPFEPIDPARLVLLRDEKGALRRVNQIETPVGRLVATAPWPAPARSQWPDTPVSRLLFPERFR